VDKVIVMKDGKISEMGTYEELVGNKGGFADFMRNVNDEKKKRKQYETMLQHKMTLFSRNPKKKVLLRQRRELRCVLI
jgi:hypothetical protein